LSFDVLSTPERLAMLEHCERFRRCLPAVEHPLINQLGAQADATELAANCPRRWPIGCASAGAKHGGASTKPTTWGRASR
jgi:hypothetical protein